MFTCSSLEKVRDVQAAASLLVPHLFTETFSYSSRRFCEKGKVYFFIESGIDTFSLGDKTAVY